METPPPGETGGGRRKDANGLCHKPVFHWRDVCYDISIKGTPRSILTYVDGWAKPGTLTALMVRSFLSMAFPAWSTPTNQRPARREQRAPARQPCSTCLPTG